MDSRTPEGATTIDAVRAAIDALDGTQWARLYKRASILLGGTQYRDPQELLNEAVVRTLRAANGEHGRHWPASVPFVAYLMQTIRGLASDSRESLAAAPLREMETLATDSLSADEALGAHGQFHPDVVTLAIEAGECAEARENAQADVAKIDAFFAGDNEVGWIIEGTKEGLQAKEIRELAEMTPTQYETARKRLRRGLEKLFSSRNAA